MPNAITGIQSPQVYPPRHPAEELTGSRLQMTDGEVAVVHVPLPQDAPASLSHVAVAIDIAAGQAAVGLLAGQGAALRTLSLNAQLCADLAPGTWVRVHARARARQGQSILASCEAFDAAGSLVALGTCRFVVVEAPRRTARGFSTEALDLSAVPSSWDAELALGEAVLREEGGTSESLFEQSAAPTAATDNASSMVHGGVQVRALELGMDSALSLSGSDSQVSLSDVAVVFHRPVPIGTGTGVKIQSAVRRRGRRVGVATASFVDADHKLLSMAEGVFTMGRTLNQGP